MCSVPLSPKQHTYIQKVIKNINYLDYRKNNTHFFFSQQHDNKTTKTQTKAPNNTTFYTHKVVRYSLYIIAFLVVYTCTYVHYRGMNIYVTPLLFSLELIYGSDEERRRILRPVTCEANDLKGWLSRKHPHIYIP